MKRKSLVALCSGPSPCNSKQHIQAVRTVLLVSYGTSFACDFSFDVPHRGLTIRELGRQNKPDALARILCGSWLHIRAGLSPGFKNGTDHTPTPCSPQRERIFIMDHPTVGGPNPNRRNCPTFRHFLQHLVLTPTRCKGFPLLTCTLVDLEARSVHARRGMPKNLAPLGPVFCHLPGR
jgi:hypothetical protein